MEYNLQWVNTANDFQIVQQKKRWIEGKIAPRSCAKEENENGNFLPSFSSGYSIIKCAAAKMKLPSNRFALS